MDKYKILIVDDEYEMRFAIQLGLRRVGYLTEVAVDGEDALLKLRNEKFDLIISDVRMPKLNGMEFMKSVRVNSPEIPIIIMTAHGTIETAVDAIKKGATDFIIKPFPVEVLENTIKKYLKSKNKPENTDNKYCIVTSNEKMQNIIRLLDNVAQSNATVLIQGESGTGKELIARHIHSKSLRNNGPFIAVNCAALPDNLLESELFGHEKGAFTGALERKIGKFELANKGTILLDEISEMSITLQAKLLRVLQERVVDRIGGKQPVEIDIRVVATTNRNLKEYVKLGNFREDLYYRLNVIPVNIPSLRERPDDISEIANYYLHKFSTENSKVVEGFTREANDLLTRGLWKGNVRELKNSIERAVLMATGRFIGSENLYVELNDGNHVKDVIEMPLPSENDGVKEPVIETGMTIGEMEKYLIMKTLKKLNGNRTHAAEILGISLRTLRNKLREYRGEESYLEAI